MSDEHRTIDTSVLDELIEIRKQQQQIDDFCRRAGELRQKVSDSVYQRVLDDYAKRRAELQHRAVPLESNARAAYKDLCSSHDDINKAFERARAAKEELEFRHEVGELDGNQLSERLTGPIDTIDQCQAELAALDGIKARFLEAMAASDLDAGPSSAEPAANRPIPAPAPHSGQTTVDVDGGAANAPPPVSLTPVADADPSAKATPLPGASARAVSTPAPGETRLASPDMAGDGPVGDAIGWNAGVDEAVTSETMLLPEGVLVSEESGVEYPLGVFNYLGRSEDSHVRIVHPGVSRHHAVVVAQPDGFTIRDLQSQNGTFVNDQRIAEQQLHDGDRVRVGDLNLRFRSDPAVVRSARRAERKEPAKGLR
jgi:hypothetical protein